MLYQVADNTAVSIPYGKGKEVGDYDENMSFSEVSIPYGKGKANPMLKTFEEILYQSPMGKVTLRQIRISPQVHLSINPLWER